MRFSLRKTLKLAGATIFGGNILRSLNVIIKRFFLFTLLIGYLVSRKITIYILNTAPWKLKINDILFDKFNYLFSRYFIIFNFKIHLLLEFTLPLISTWFGFLEKGKFTEELCMYWKLKLILIWIWCFDSRKSQ